MSAISTLGMTPARRRIFEAGIQAEAGRALAEAQRQQAERQEAMKRQAAAAAAWRDAARPHPATAIIAEVAAKHGLTTADLTGSRRTLPIARARQEAMWRMRQLSLTTTDIGRRLGGRDHTTALWGIRQHQRRIDDAKL